MYCAVTAKAKNGEPSELFNELTQKYERDIAKSIWAMVTSETFMDVYKDSLILNGQGEPTFDSIKKFINHTYTDNYIKLLEKFTRELNGKSYKTSLDMLSDVVRFNDEHPDYIAEVKHMSGNEYYIQVNKSNQNTNAIKNEFKREIKKLEAIDQFMSDLGFPIHWLDQQTMKENVGLLQPNKVVALENDVFGVMNVVNSVGGAYAISHEFSHFLIEVLSTKTQLVDRLLNLIKNDKNLMYEVLQEEMENYTNEEPEREVLSRLLQMELNDIMEGGYEIRNKPIWKRFIDAVKDFLYRTFKFTNDTYQSKVDYLRKQISEASKVVYKERKLSDETTKAFSEFDRSLHQFDEVRIKTENLVKKAINKMTQFQKVNHMIDFDLGEDYETYQNLLSQMRSDFDKLRSMSKYATEDQKKTISESYIVMIKNYLSDTMTVVNKLFTKLEQYRDTIDNVKNSSAKLSTDVILSYSHELMEIKRFMDSFAPITYGAQKIYNDILSRYAKQGIINGDLVDGLMDARTELLTAVDNLNGVFKNITHDVVHDFLIDHFNGGQPITVPYGPKTDSSLSPDVSKVITLTSIMDSTMNWNVSYFERMLVTAYDCGDLFVQVVALSLDSFDNKVRERMNNLNTAMQAIHREYYKATGSNDTSFVYSNRIENKDMPTGYFVSKYDYPKYLKEQQEYQKHLDEYTQMGNYMKKQAMAKWEREHTQVISVAIYDKDGRATIRYERVPIYTCDDVDKLNEHQRKYYDSLMEIKKEMDFLLPQNRVALYKAPQRLMSDCVEAFYTSNYGNKFRNACKIAWNNISKFSQNDYEDLYSSMTTSPSFKEKLKSVIKSNNKMELKQIALDFDGTPLKTVPYMYVSMLSDLSLLSRDASSSVLEYGMSAIHYSEMHKMADIYELVKMISEMREHTFNTSEKILINKTAMAEEANKPNYGSHSDEMLKNFIDKRVYSLYRDDNKYHKLARNVMRYASFSILGWNHWTSIANVTIGNHRLFNEAVGGYYFSMGDLIKAEAIYFKLLLGRTRNAGVAFDASKLDLISKLLNIGNKGEEELRDQDFFQDRVTKVLGSIFSPQAGMSAGEHWIQHVPVIAMMLSYKLAVTDDNGNIIKETNLFDILEEKKIYDDKGVHIASTLEIPKNTYTVTKDDSGNTVINEAFEIRASNSPFSRFLLNAGKVCQTMHGIYNRQNGPEAERYVFGKLLLMFRKHIMPMLRDNYKSIGQKSPHYNLRSDLWEEGAIATMARYTKYLFGVGPYMSMVEDENSTFAMRWKDRSKILDKYREANLRKAIFQTAMIALHFVYYLKGEPDRDTWFNRMLRYFLLRLGVETRASVLPFGDLMTLLVSPTAVTGILQNWLKVFNAMIYHHGEKVRKGKNAGKTKAEAAFEKALPVYGQTRDFITADENRMRVFNPKYK